MISDVHYDLWVHFEHHGLAEYVDAFTLSFRHGCQKPSPCLFEIALEALGSSRATRSWLGIVRVGMAAR